LLLLLLLLLLLVAKLLHSGSKTLAIRFAWLFCLQCSPSRRQTFKRCHHFVAVAVESW